MNTKHILFLGLCCYAIGINAQNQSPTTDDLLSINFLIPSLEYETSVSSKATLDFSLGTAVGFSKQGGNSEIGFFPTFILQYRYFYNFENRLKKDKKVSQNTGNYFGLETSGRSGNAIFGDLQTIEDVAGFIGPIWGMQRIYNSGFKLNFHLGAGYGFNDLGESYFSPIIGIRLGWLLSSK